MSGGQNLADARADMDEQPDQMTEPTTTEPSGPPSVPTPARSDLPPARCTPSLDDIFRYMDGQLDEERGALFHSHMADCGGCGEAYDVQAQFRRLIELRCQTELPSELRDKVFGAIAELELGPDS